MVKTTIELKYKCKKKKKFFTETDINAPGYKPNFKYSSLFISAARWEDVRPKARKTMINIPSDIAT
jgi:hypothetical protein